MDAEADPTRMYASGYFDASQGTPARNAAAVQTVQGAPLAAAVVAAGLERLSKDYQRAIRLKGSACWVGGSEHSLFSFSTRRSNGTYTYDHESPRVISRRSRSIRPA